MKALVKFASSKYFDEVINGDLKRFKKNYPPIPEMVFKEPIKSGMGGIALGALGLGAAGTGAYLYNKHRKKKNRD